MPLPVVPAAVYVAVPVAVAVVGASKKLYDKVRSRNLDASRIGPVDLSHGPRQLDAYAAQAAAVATGAALATAHCASWEWEDGEAGSGQWRSYYRVQAQQLAAAASAGRLTTVLRIHGEDYTVDLAAMTQTRASTGWVRAVRQAAATAESAAAATAAATAAAAPLPTAPPLDSLSACGPHTYPGGRGTFADEAAMLRGKLARKEASLVAMRSLVPASQLGHVEGEVQQLQAALRALDAPVTVPVGAADAPLPLTCVVCCLDVPAADYRGRLASGCAHDRKICTDCCQRHIGAEINDKGNAFMLHCPEAGCGAQLEHGDVQQFATAQIFARFDELLTQQALQQMPDFRWCCKCEAGQVVDGSADNPIMNCSSCGAKTCYVHRTAWHSGQTCEEYEQQERAKLDRYMHMHGSNQCPGCHMAIEKTDGCDHMTCNKTYGGCGFEFCWLCNADYNGPAGIRAVGNTAHDPACKYHM
eukprot:SAG22_NODE_819_length_7014_cov_16.053073_2_plen_472_part_00